MRIAILASAAIALVLATGLGCGHECRFSSQCGEGEHCDFTVGKCIPGCRSSSDCAATARCDSMLGRCIAMFPGIPSDAATSTAATDASGLASEGGERRD